MDDLEYFTNIMTEQLEKSGEGEERGSALRMPPHVLMTRARMHTDTHTRTCVERFVAHLEQGFSSPVVTSGWVPSQPAPFFPASTPNQAADLSQAPLK